MTYAAPISTYNKVDIFNGIIVTSAEVVGANNEEVLSFMETFSFPNLKNIKASLKKANYSTEEVTEIISGLKTLPEYKRG